MHISRDEFIAAWHRAGCSPEAVAQFTGLSIRNVYDRRKRLAAQGIVLPTIASTPSADATSSMHEWKQRGRAYKSQNDFRLRDGTAIIFSDAHFWPDQPKSVAHLALLELLKDLKPQLVVANGDVFDGARVSRHAPMGWVDLPTVKQEIEICEDYLHEIQAVADARRSAFFWNIGNHDQRFDRMLAQNASEYEGVIPRLEDKFPRWELGWSLNINDTTMVKHRYHNGVHAGYNNALKSGRNIVTGHMHRLLVTPWGDYNGRRYGVDTGTLSDLSAPQFEYAENNPSPHTSGFAVLNYKDGMLLPPELCEVIGGHAYFRGAQVV